jgi:CubicO group peptidase (beta-lactamase class C family)
MPGSAARASGSICPVEDRCPLSDSEAGLVFPRIEAMKFRALGLWIGILLFACHGSRADQVDELVGTEMAAHGIPGLALTVIQNGTSTKTSGYGLANLELNVPVKPETVFEIGSVTKQFTAALVLLLAQDGKLSVDEKIGQYLSSIPDTWRDIKVRHLLTHTSGIKSYTGLDGFELRRHLTQAQFIAAIGAQPLEFQPGQAWKYSNTGFNLLGFIIENVTDKTYWDFLSERILRPLGMTSTTNRLPALIIPNRASGYEQTNHIFINRDYDLTDVFSAGALVSTVGDLAKWNNALDREAVLNTKSKQAMWQPAVLNDGKMTQYGFGWRIEALDGHKNIGHGGSTSGFSATIQRFPDDQLAVIILTNTDEQIATSLARKIARLYLR